jgi:hypothetical protein
MNSTPAQKKKEDTLAEKLSDKVTQNIGTPLSVLVHTFFFVGIFGLSKFGYKTEEILLILTTVVSLEAIYLGIFIQMTVNRQVAKLATVREDIKEISEDLDEISEDSVYRTLRQYGIAFGSGYRVGGEDYGAGGGE